MIKKAAARLGALAVIAVIALLAPAAADTAEAAPCYKPEVGNSASSHITTWYSDWSGVWDYAVPGEWADWAHTRKVRVESGYDVLIGREGQGYTMRYNSTGWHAVGAWNCAGGAWITKQIPNGASGFAPTGAAGGVVPQDTNTAQAVVQVQNDNISRWLRVMEGSGGYIDIAPRAKVGVAGSSAGSRAAWVQAGCTLRKDGKSWASSPPSGGHWKDFGWQPTTINFLHVC